MMSSGASDTNLNLEHDKAGVTHYVTQQSWGINKEI